MPNDFVSFVYAFKRKSVQIVEEEVLLHTCAKARSLNEKLINEPISLSRVYYYVELNSYRYSQLNKCSNFFVEKKQKKQTNKLRRNSKIVLSLVNV